MTWTPTTGSAPRLRTSSPHSRKTSDTSATQYDHRVNGMATGCAEPPPRCTSDGLTTRAPTRAVPVSETELQGSRRLSPSIAPTKTSSTARSPDAPWWCPPTATRNELWAICGLRGMRHVRMAAARAGAARVDGPAEFGHSLVHKSRHTLEPGTRGRKEGLSRGGGRLA